jgi:hypothetical protein
MPDLMTSTDAGRELALMNIFMTRMKPAEPSVVFVLQEAQRLLIGMLHSLEQTELVARLQAQRIASLKAELVELQQAGSSPAS